MSGFTYPIYKKLKDDGLIVEFVSLHSGYVFSTSFAWPVKGEFSDEWVPHTEPDWQDWTPPNEDELVRSKMEQTTNTVKDNINPTHYKQGGIETIDYMKAKSTPEEFRGHLRLTAIKYLSRYGHKDDTLQELKKAKWYLDKLIEELEK